MKRYFRKPIKRYCYLDETGHSGMNYFDSNQEYFILGCASSTTDLNCASFELFTEMKQKLNVTELHGNELGPYKLSQISKTLIKVIKKNNLQFFFIMVEKKYFLGLMFFHLIYDSELNPEVNEEYLGIKYLRMGISYYFIKKLTDEDYADFWESVRQKNITKFQVLIQRQIEKFKDNHDNTESLDFLLYKALDYTLKSPHEIFDSMMFNQMASPNSQAFSMMVNTLNQFYQNSDVSIVKFTHDEQEEMAKFLKMNFKIFTKMTISQAPDVHLTDYVPTSLIEQSELILESSSNSNGLQLIDIVLWIAYRKYNGKSLEGLDTSLLNTIMERSFADGNTLKNHSSFLKIHSPLNP